MRDPEQADVHVFITDEPTGSDGRQYQLSFLGRGDFGSVEYSLLPYDLATRRAITVVYQLGLAYVDYFEETIYNQTEESLFSQQLSASVAIRQPWGEIYGGLEGSHYFHDFSKRRAEFFGVVSVRLLEGLSLNVQGEFQMIRDQLSLPLGDATLEEILLQQLLLRLNQTSYHDHDLSTHILLRYRTAGGGSSADVPLLRGVGAVRQRDDRVERSARASPRLVCQ